MDLPDPLDVFAKIEKDEKASKKSFSNLSTKEIKEIEQILFACGTTLADVERFLSGATSKKREQILLLINSILSTKNSQEKTSLGKNICSFLE